MKFLLLMFLVLLPACSDNSSTVPAGPSVPENCVAIDANDTETTADYVSNGVGYSCKKESDSAES